MVSVQRCCCHVLELASWHQPVLAGTCHCGWGQLTHTPLGALGNTTAAALPPLLPVGVGGCPVRALRAWWDFCAVRKIALLHGFASCHLYCCKAVCFHHGLLFFAAFAVLGRWGGWTGHGHHLVHNGRCWLVGGHGCDVRVVVRLLLGQCCVQHRCCCLRAGGARVVWTSRQRRWILRWLVGVDLDAGPCGRCRCGQGVCARGGCGPSWLWLWCSVAAGSARVVLANRCRLALW